ncbi:MAG: pyridoxamine 5'-phosphate oxidase family protein [Desulfovibrio sp.]|nr:pyridoxamine 5'-phosphate oxidase family protein [Desulfovibrio sp.]
MSDYQVRRKDRELGPAETWAVLEQGEFGTLATVDATGSPYAVPVSYVVMDGQICFHCALVGHKTDNLAVDARVVFVVVGQASAAKNDFAVNYSSAIVFGRAHLVENSEQKYAVLYALAEKYQPALLKAAPEYIRRHFAATAVYVIQPGKITGKARKDK